MEIKEMVALARKAQKEYQATHNQQSVDNICRAAAKVIYENAEMLAREAVDETGMGVYEDKVSKNRGKSKGVWYNLHDKKSVGILNIDERTGLIEIAKPMGVVGAVTPTTNPIVTPMSNIIFALKTCNAIIISPHPRSKKCSKHAVDLILEAIKPLQDGVIADIDSTKEMITYFIHKIYGNSLFKPEVMICVPIEVTSVERKALFDAVKGAKKTYIIEEGRAAIIGSGVNISQPEGSMVIDIGGGSTDIAILSLDEIIASKSIRIAGNKFDEDIVKYVKRKYNLLIGDRTAEKIKKEMATAIKLQSPEVMEIKGRDLESGIPNTVEINANEIYEAIEDSLFQIVNSTKEVLEKCPPELAADILDNGIVMTGGGSLIQNFVDMMEKEVGIKVFLSPNPLDSVVLGGGAAFDNKKLLRTLQMKEN